MSPWLAHPCSSAVTLLSSVHVLRKGLLATALCAAFTLPTTLASGESSPPRFKLRAGVSLKQAVGSLKRLANRAPGFSNIDCWMWDGNARIGWRHGSCVGNYNYGGRQYRFKGTWTPVSCSKLRYAIVIPGADTARGVTPWKHQTFICG